MKSNDIFFIKLSKSYHQIYFQNIKKSAYYLDEDIGSLDNFNKTC